MSTVLSRTRSHQEEDQPQDRQSIPNLLFLLLAFAFVLRIFLVLYPEIIYSDGVEYIRCAKLILSGNWGGSKAPPFYPVLIALASRFTSNFESAGIWVSVIFGTALLLPVFYLGREIFNEKIGILSALFAAVHPYLYVSSGSVLTESVYHFLLTTAVLFGWRAFRRGKIRDILLFSFLTALAYFTRPEAVGFLFIFGFWVLFIRPSEEKRHALKRVWIGALAILCFLVFSSPYLYQMRKETGRWELSKKFSISIGSVSEGEAVPLEDFTRTKKITLVSFLVEPVGVLKKLGVGGIQALYRFQLSFHPLLFVLALIGFVWSMREVSFRKGSFYLLSYFIFYLGLLLPFLWIARRYTAMISPIALPWASLGFVGLTEWVAPRLKAGKWKRSFPVLSLLLVLIVIFIQGRVVHGRGHRLLHKEVGLWMKDHFSKDGNVMMSRLPQIGFYAEMPWIIMPDKSYEEIMERAHSKGIRYLIIDEKVREPAVFLQKAGKELIRIRDWKDTGEWLILFEIRRPA